jgi:hypothetical protein
VDRTPQDDHSGRLTHARRHRGAAPPHIPGPAAPLTVSAVTVKQRPGNSSGRLKSILTAAGDGRELMDMPLKIITCFRAICPAPPQAHGDRTGSKPRPRASRRARRSLPRLLPRTVQLCIHCQENPAGFWVSGKGGQTARRPWCLSCCEALDPSRYDMILFGT